MTNRRLKLLGLFALVAILLCYKLDFECLLEGPSQACHESILSDCSQPNLAPLAAVLIPARAALPAPPLEIVSGPLWDRLALESTVPIPVPAPLGQRAPPSV